MSALLTVIPKKIAHCSPKCSIRELKVLHWTILVPKLTRKSRVLKRFLPQEVFLNMYCDEISLITQTSYRTI